MITEDLIPKRFHIVIDWNPMAWVVRAYRDRLLSGAWPHLHDLSVLAAYSIAVFVAGGLFFRHLKRGFADVL
jgi:lipopolysaccharide transport system permease protein